MGVSLITGLKAEALFLSVSRCRLGGASTSFADKKLCDFIKGLNLFSSNERKIVNANNATLTANVSGQRLA
jgi:hypothetical protein